MIINKQKRLAARGYQQRLKPIEASKKGRNEYETILCSKHRYFTLIETIHAITFIAVIIAALLVSQPHTAWLAWLIGAALLTAFILPLVPLKKRKRLTLMAQASKSHYPCFDQFYEQPAYLRPLAYIGLALFALLTVVHFGSTAVVSHAALGFALALATPYVLMNLIFKISLNNN
jgi:hypothetical protein